MTLNPDGTKTLVLGKNGAAETSALPSPGDQGRKPLVVGHQSQMVSDRVSLL